MPDKTVIEWTDDFGKVHTEEYYDEHSLNRRTWDLAVAGYNVDYLVDTMAEDEDPYWPKVREV